MSIRLEIGVVVNNNIVMSKYNVPSTNWEQGSDDKFPENGLRESCIALKVLIGVERFCGELRKRKTKE